jgi:hypothetical protein
MTANASNPGHFAMLRLITSANSHIQIICEETCIPIAAVKHASTSKT